MNSRLAIVVFIFAFLVVIAVGFNQRDRDSVTSSAVTADTSARSPSSTPSQPPVASPLPQGSPSPLVGTAPHAMNLERFRTKYGSEFSAELGTDGVVSALVNEGRAQAASGFSLRDEAAVIARAKSVLVDAGALLGIRKDMPLVLPKVSVTSASANVVFTESVDGVPLLSAGQVTVLLNAEGGVQAIYSSYQTSAVVQNEPKLNSNGRVHWLWKESVNAQQVAVLRHVYETRNRGFQVLTDAESGQVVLQRDRRIH